MDFEIERKRMEFEAALELTLDAVREQFLEPLLHAFYILTYATTHKMDGPWVAEQLKQQFDTCPTDVAGRGLLLILAEMAAAPDLIPPDVVHSKVSTSLRLILGRKKK